jgi:hypothetical protein
MKTIKATEIKVNDTVTYCGATYQVVKITNLTEQGLLMLTPNDAFLCEQSIDYDREVVLEENGKTRRPNLVHWNRFTKAGTIRTQEARFGTTFCGKSPKIESFASSRNLVTCEQCKRHMQ